MLMNATQDCVQVQQNIREDVLNPRMVTISHEQCDKLYSLRLRCLDPSIVVAPIPRAVIAPSASHDHIIFRSSTTPYVIPLKGEADLEEEEDEDDPQECKSQTVRAKSSVIFDQLVSVILIPHRKDYSSEVKRLLWSDRREIQENASRNMIEWEAEGYDWRSVIEDEDFIDHDGERVHPIHGQVALMAKRPPSPPSSIMKDLPKPIPQRPKHPSLHCDDFTSSWEPVIRPTNPIPY